MIVRCGYLLGCVRPQAQPDFDNTLVDVLLPAIREMPGVERAEVHFAQDAEPGAPDIHATFMIHFADEKAMETALSSPERQRMREKFIAILPGFDGTVAHINHTLLPRNEQSGLCQN
ncbi:hypothetical protein I5535_12570 [Rhodobacteraceae bacterium F11138]|nr:hypothetical protein [Rhodobacteraceae bacterium F11138]